MIRLSTPLAAIALAITFLAYVGAPWANAIIAVLGLALVIATLNRTPSNGDTAPRCLRQSILRPILRSWSRCAHSPT